ncbi:hypothetical protein QTP88_018222 [Uroleucon formosanum]
MDGSYASGKPTIAYKSEEFRETGTLTHLHAAYQTVLGRLTNRTTTENHDGRGPLDVGQPHGGYKRLQEVTEVTRQPHGFNNRVQPQSLYRGTITKNFRNGNQVGTGTGIMTHYFNLFVIVPTAIISGSDEYHTPEGNSIVLCCKIENSPVPPQYVLWYHNGKVLSSGNFNKNGLKTDRLSISTEQIDHKIYSRLTITKAIQIDTGNYTCQPPNTDPDSTYIHITPEIDNTAAIQRHKSSNSALLVTELSIFPLTSFLLIGHNGFRWVFL